MLVIHSTSLPSSPITGLFGRGLLTALKMANELAKNVTVIGRSDLERMRRLAGGKDSQEQVNFEVQAEKAVLYEKSRKRMDNWGNTIEALRAKKYQDRLKKFEVKELERRKIDEEEARIAEAIRTSALEKAAKQIYDEQDRVKSLHSKMLLSDVLQERELQLELRRRKQEQEREIQGRWLELEQQQLADYDARTLDKMRQTQQKKTEFQRAIRGQVKETIGKAVRHMREEELEGELIKRDAKRAIEEERQKELERRRRAQVTLDETKQANEHLKELKRQEAERDRAEEDRQAMFAMKKEEMMRLRKEREEHKFKEKLATRQRMIDARAAELLSIKNTEEQRLSNQIQEAEAKARADFERKEKRRQDLADQIERSRQAQMNRRQQEKKLAKVEEAEFTEAWKARMDDLHQQEQDEREEEKRRAIEIQDFRKRQMDFKAKKAEVQAQQDLEHARELLAQKDFEDDQFNSYAEKCLQEWAAQGKNVTPLILELKSYRKKVS
jgi:hypothetical protein